MLRVTGIILAGGYSRRMGSDKALLELEGQPVIARIAAELTQITDNVLIASGEEQREEYSFLQYPLVVDHYPGCGPLAGLHAAICASITEWNLVTACDLPFVTANFMHHMMDVLMHNVGTNISTSTAAVSAIVAVSSTGRVQPLFGLYHKDVLPSLESVLSRQELRVMKWLEGLNVIYVSEAEVAESPDSLSSLLNMNTLDDYNTTISRTSNRLV